MDSWVPGQSDYVKRHCQKKNKNLIIRVCCLSPSTHLFFLSFLSVYGYFACMYVCTHVYLVPMEEKGGFWEWNPRPLEEDPVLLTVELSFQHPSPTPHTYFLAFWGRISSSDLPETHYVAQAKPELIYDSLPGSVFQVLRLQVKTTTLCLFLGLETLFELHLSSATELFLDVYRVLLQFFHHLLGLWQVYI